MNRLSDRLSRCHSLLLSPRRLRPPAQDRDLIWSDEFDGAPGSPPDPAKWVYDLGGGGWGNQELEVYTRQPRQFPSGWPGPPGDPSARGLARQVHLRPPEDARQVRLRVWARAKRASGFPMARASGRPSGCWAPTSSARDGPPAARSTSWKTSAASQIPCTAPSTVRAIRANRRIGKPFQLAAGRFADDYHIYAVEWTPDRIDFLVDGQIYHTVTPASLPAGTKWVYDHPFFLILNVAVGGEWPHNPDETSVFPQTMLVDYVRVYRR